MRRNNSKYCKILIFCTIFVVNHSSAQQIQLKDSSSKASSGKPRLYFSPNSSLFYPLQPVSADFYVKNLGFFCRQELKLEAVTKIPFKFRLGSVNYCDRMEGKKNAGILPAY